MRWIRALVSLCLLSLPGLAWADGPQFTGTCATLSWNANTESDLAGYKLYDRVTLTATPLLRATYGAQITSVTCASLGFNAGQHYLTLTAFDTSGNESGPSTEFPFVILTNAVTDLAVTTINSTDMVLSFTEVDGGTGSPADYAVRLATPTINWGTAAEVTSGTCATPMTGTAIGATKTCTVTGLSTTTPYQFQLVPFRGVYGTTAVFSPLSNIASGTTGGSPPAVTERITLQSDGFGRADGSLGQFWDDGYTKNGNGVNALQIVSNKVRATNVAADAFETFNEGTLPNDDWVQATTATLTGGGCQSVRLLLHFSPPPTVAGYEILALKGCGAETSYLVKRTNGVFQSLANESATTWVSTDVMRAEYRNGQLALYRNDVLVLAVDDATFPSGRAGFGMYNDTAIANTEVTSWSAGGFVATTADVCGCDNH